MALFMANTSNIHEMKFGRPQTVMHTADLPNCTIVTLGGTMESTAPELDHVHAVTVEALTAVAGKYIIVAPEINAQQYRTIDGQIGKFVLEANETYSAYMLSLLDRIEYSDAYFAKPADAIVGAKFNVNATGKLEKAVSDGALKVISVRDLWLPIVLQANIAGAQGSGNPAKLMPASVKMIKVEVQA